jgi:hypothetical protein
MVRLRAREFNARIGSQSLFCIGQTTFCGAADTHGLEPPAMRIELPRPIGWLVLLGLALYAVWWGWTFTGATGELTPTSRARILFPILGHTAFHTRGYVWARQGDTIVVDYDVRLDSGYFNITIGKTRWPFRRLLRHEERRAFRSSASGQLRYQVKQNGRHAIWAGTYSVWAGEARVRWRLIRGNAAQDSARTTYPGIPFTSLHAGGACAVDSPSQQR